MVRNSRREAEGQENKILFAFFYREHPLVFDPGYNRKISMIIEVTLLTRHV